MVHPDYQYTPKLIPAMASILAKGLYPCVLGSRILGATPSLRPPASQLGVRNFVARGAIVLKAD